MSPSGEYPYRLYIQYTLVFASYVTGLLFFVRFVWRRLKGFFLPFVGQLGVGSQGVGHRVRCGAGGNRGLSANVSSFFLFFLVYFSSVVVGVAIVFPLSFGIWNGSLLYYVYAAYLGRFLFSVAFARFLS